jgi:hypothetical protein
VMTTELPRLRPCPLDRMPGARGPPGSSCRAVTRVRDGGDRRRAGAGLTAWRQRPAPVRCRAKAAGQAAAHSYSPVLPVGRCAAGTFGAASGPRLLRLPGYPGRIFTIYVTLATTSPPRPVRTFGN